MKFNLMKKFASGICAAVVGMGVMSVGAFAEDIEMKGSDENTVAQAGIVWMIKEQWDHRNNVGLPALDEMETAEVSCTHDDVNISGDGEYEVSFSGYCLPADKIQFYEIGNLAVAFLVDLEKYPDFKAEISECTIDGTTYTVNEQPELEEQGDVRAMKIKNAYGKNAVTTPEMDAKPWTTTDPITIKFTVSGFGKDKIADNANEVIETKYGNGSVENDPKEEESSIAEEESSVVVTTTTTASASESSVSDSSKSDSSESSVNWMLYGCIAGGIVVVIVVVAVIAKKKS